MRRSISQEGCCFAGYGGVIGTMRSISDKLAPVVARDVYERLFLFRMGAARRGKRRSTSRPSSMWVF
ncbi:hypothetical protein L210DRAFT_3548818, partial [Boletus edulis BED1]